MDILLDVVTNEISSDLNSMNSFQNGDSQTDNDPKSTFLFDQSSVDTIFVTVAPNLFGGVKILDNYWGQAPRNCIIEFLSNSTAPYGWLHRHEHQVAPGVYSGVGRGEYIERGVGPINLDPETGWSGAIYMTVPSGVANIKMTVTQS